MRTTISTVTVVGCWLVAVGSIAHADDKQASQKIEPAKVALGRPVDFTKDVQPILEAKCIACHNEAILEGKLNLEQAPLVLKGGKRGAAVVPHEPEKSLLFKFASRSVTPAMPPIPNTVSAEPLTPQELGMIRQWILEGAAAGSDSSKSMIEWQPLPIGLNAIYSVAISPWGRFAASGRANQIVIYDTETGSETAQLIDPNLAKVMRDGKPMYGHGAAHRDFVHSLAFSPDETMLASGGYRVVKLWRRAQNVQKLRVAAPAAVTAVALRADGQLMAVAAADNSIALVNVADGATVRKLAGHAAKVTALEFWPTLEEKTAFDKTAHDAEAAAAVATRKAAEANELAAANPKDAKLAEAKVAADAAAKAAAEAGKKAADEKAAFDKKVAAQSKLVSASHDKTIRVWNPADGAQALLITGPAAINDIALNIDATQVVSADADNKLRVWNAQAASDKPLRELAGHEKPVTAVALVRPAGAQIVSGSEDGTVRLWNLADGAMVRSMKHDGPVTSVAVRADGLAAASCGSNQLARLWNLPDGAQIAEMKGDLAAIHNVTLLTEAQTIAKQKVDLADAAVKAAEANVKEREETAKKSVETKAAADKALVEVKAKDKPEAEKLAAAKAELEKNKDKADLKKKVTDAEAAVAAQTEAVKKAVEAQASAVTGQDRAEKALVAAKEKLGATNSAKKASEEHSKAAEANVKERDETAKKSVETKAAADKALVEVKAKDKPEAEKLAAAKAELEKNKDNADLKKKVTDAEAAVAAQTEAVKKAVEAQASAVTGQDRADKALVAAKEKLGATNSAKKASEEHSKAAEAKVAEATAAAAASAKVINSISFSPGGSTVATSGEDGIVRLHSAANGKPLETFGGHGGPVAAVAFASPSLLVSGSTDKSTIVWNTNPGWTLVGQLGASTTDPLDISGSPLANRVLALDFSRDGKLLATGGGDPSRNGELMIWDVAALSLVREIKDAHSDTVMGVEFSRDGKQLLSGGADKFVKIFDVETGNFVRSFEGHTHHVLDVSWKADGSQIASAGADNAIKVWNVETGEQIRTISGHTKQVTAIQYIGVGDHILTCGGDKLVAMHQTSNGGKVRDFTGGADYMYAAAVSRDEAVVVAGGEDGVLRIWNGADGKAIAAIDPPRY